MAFKVKIISPSGVVFDKFVDKLNIVTSGGELTILPHHMPLISTLKQDARISVYVNGKRNDYIASSGVLTVKESETIVVVDNIHD